MKPGFVYALQPQGLDLVKIGCTHDPVGRAEQLGSFSPMPMAFRCVMQVSCFEAAQVFEGLILHLTSDVATHGEWRGNLPFVDDCMRCIAPAVDVTGDYGIVLRRPARRKAMTFDRADDLIAVAEAIAHLTDELAPDLRWNAKSEARRRLGISCYTSVINKKVTDLARLELAKRSA